MTSKRLCLLFSLFLCAAVRADVMNLNEFVPTHLEDATPVDEHKTILQLSSQYEDQNPDDVTWRPDIRYGLTDRIQLEILNDFISGGQESTSGETKAGFLYELNESGSAFPVFSLNPVLQLPTGKGLEGIDAGAKVLVTSTLSGTSKEPETQLHLNYELLHNAARKPGERTDEILFGFGFSRKIRPQMALVLDYFYQEDLLRERTESYVETGIHQKVSEKWYIGYGLGKGMNPTTPEWMGLVSVELVM